MFSSTSFLVVVTLLASSAFSATIPGATGETVGPWSYVADPSMNWANGKLWDSTGAVALETKQNGNMMEFHYNQVVAASIEIPKKEDICTNNVVVKDITGVTFTVQVNKQPYGLYAWTFVRPDGTSFFWSPYSDSTTGINAVGGIVSEKSDTKHATHSGEIWEYGKPKGFPSGLIADGKSAWTITVEGPADVKYTPRPLEMVELTYLLAQRNSICGQRTD